MTVSLIDSFFLSQLMRFITIELTTLLESNTSASIFGTNNILPLPNWDRDCPVPYL